MALFCESYAISSCVFESYRVPYLKLDLLAIDIDHPSSKFHSNSQVMDRLEALVRELQKQAGLPHACTAENGESPPACRCLGSLENVLARLRGLNNSRGTAHLYLR